ncbi:chorismate mutase [Mycobacterium sp. IS-3022]|uniref:chorismate mutase n=1 Tax=Mycobacterium sp. IS-3022 TaxID=1772277 RepID=UPI000B33AD2B|nr:chorismate mutase [Mycobacterium sp. IS-3022]
MVAPRMTTSALVTLLVAISLPVAHAQPVSPLYRLVDTAAQRLATADPVAAAKWINGGPITDRQRADAVLDTVAADAAAHAVDPAYVRTIFTDQIDATEGIQYTRFGQWKFDPTSAPTAAPELSELRSQIDGLNKIMVEEIALQWNTLHSPDCMRTRKDATDAVANARQLDPLYRQALSAATRAYCRIT